MYFSSVLNPSVSMSSHQFKSHNTYFFLKCRAGTTHRSSNEQPQAELRNRDSDVLILKYSYVWMGQNKSIPQKKKRR